MARSRKSSSRSIVLNSNVEVHVTEVPFRPFDSVRHLDVERLSRAKRARFELGTFESGCCRRVVHAVVERGIVTKVEFEPCEKVVRLTPELERLVKTARKELALRNPPTTSLPVPVTRFLAKPIGPNFDAWACIKICCFGHCLTCCFHVGNGPFWVGCAIDKIPFPGRL